MSTPFSQACSPMPTAATMLALCAFLFLPLGLPALPTMITLSSRPQSACAVTEFFHNAHAYFTIQIRMRSHEFFSQCACVVMVLLRKGVVMVLLRKGVLTSGCTHVHTSQFRYSVYLQLYLSIQFSIVFALNKCS